VDFAPADETHAAAAPSSGRRTLHRFAAGALTKTIPFVSGDEGEYSTSMNPRPVSRRQFVGRFALAGLGTMLGARHLFGAEAARVASPVRVVFATDSHLMLNDALDSARGLAQCLDAIEALDPHPDLIVCGGDLTHELPNLDYPAGEKLVDRFLEIWRDHTSLPSHFTFGNHDLAATRLAGAKKDDPHFGKGLFRERLHLEKTFYSFDAGGWHFVVLDDVAPNPDGTYLGEYAQEQLQFLRGDLAAAAGRPSVICGHIPCVSILPTVAGLAKIAGRNIETPVSLVAANTRALLDIITTPNANVKLLLAGHLHHLEQVTVDGIAFLNGGAICGNWWKGAQAGCPEGFTVLDLQADGTFAANYRSYNWKAVG
jgi:Icc protein